MTRPSVAQLEGHLRPGQVLLVQRHGVVSRAIRKVTKSEWSHVALLAESMDVWILIESTTRWNAVAAVKLETTLYDPSVTALLFRDRSDLLEGERRRIVQAAWLQTGDAYDQGINADILWQRITGWQGILNRTRAKNCAEMVARAYLLGWGGSIINRQAPPTPESFAQTTKLTDVLRLDF